MNYQASTHTETKTMGQFFEDLSSLPMRLNIVVRWEMLDLDKAHVTVYQPRKNIIVDFVLTNADEVELEEQFAETIYKA